MTTTVQTITPALAERAGKLNPPGTSRMRAKAQALKDAGIHVISFAAGELPFDASPQMKRGAAFALEHQCNRYTATVGLAELRSALAADTSGRIGVTYNDSEIAVTAGAKQALFNATLMLLDPGDEVIVPSPYWETFVAQIILAGATPIVIDTAVDGYQLKAARVAAAVSPKTKMVVLNTPNNPTGAVYRSDELLKIAQLVMDAGIWIIFDECYRDFVRSPFSHRNIVEVCPGVKDQAVLINSFSKSHAITGWRVGYACGPKKLISAMSKLQGHTTSNPSSLAQHGALAALRERSKSFQREINGFLDEQLQMSMQYLRKIDCLSFAPPEGAFYLYLNVSKVLGRHYRGTLIPDCDTLVELLLSEAHIAVVGAAAGGDPEGIRMTYCVDRDELMSGMERLTEFMANVCE